MQGTTGTIVGVAIMAVALAGLGLAVSEMMTETAPGEALKTLAGLGVFVVAALVGLFAVAR